MEERRYVTNISQKGKNNEMKQTKTKERSGRKYIKIESPQWIGI